MRIRNAAALLLLLSGLTSCTTPGSPAGEKISADPTLPQARSTQGLDWHKLPTSPLTYFATNGKPISEVLNQISAGVDSCMTRAGFEYHTSVESTVGIFAMQTPEQAIEQSRARGYATPKPEAPSSGALLQKRLLEGLKGATASGYFRALDGERIWQKESDGALSLPPAWASGCAAGAARQVLAGLPQYTPGVSDQITAAFSRVDKSAELSDSHAKWAHCMGAHGVGGSPAEAVRLASRVGTSKTSTHGLDPKSIAVADAICSADTTQRVQQRLEYGELVAIASKSPRFMAIVSRMVRKAT